MSKKTKIIVIVGPTSSGKSELAVKLAKKFNGEIISADSRQIYKKLDIGTGKVEGKWIKREAGKFFIYKGILHHCLDFVPLKKNFNAAEFKKCAQNAIKDIESRGKTIFLAGGTGFWIDALIHGITLPPIPPNPKLRKKLEKKAAEELFEILKKLDPRRAETIEKKNARRLIRAIEIAKILGKMPKLKKRPCYTALWIGINPLPEELKKNIRKRVRKWLKRGFIKEGVMLSRQKLGAQRLSEFGFEYQLLFQYLRGELAPKEFITKLERSLFRYGKRQIRWFKKNPKIHWIRRDEAAERLLQLFIQRLD